MSILKIKDSQGNWVGVPTVKGDKGNTGNGISSAVLNDDYTLTLTFTDGTTYTTPSIRGEKGERGEPATNMEIHICSITEYDNETRVPTIVNPNSSTFYLVPTENGTSPDLFTEWVYVNGAWEMFGSAKIDLSGYLTDVQINGTSIVTDGVANVPTASASRLGVVQASSSQGIYVNSNGVASISEATSANIKTGTNEYEPITPHVEHEATFYGLAKSAGDTTQSQSSNAVGNYTDEAKVAIQKMLGLYREWELIADVTVEEDSVQVDVVTDINGQPFELTEMFVRVWLQPSTTGANDFVTAQNLLIFNNGTTDASASPTKRYMANGAPTFMEYVSKLMCGINYSFGTAAAAASMTATVEKASGIYTNIKSYRGFRIRQYSSTMTLIPAGTIIKIYGIRA